MALSSCVGTPCTSTKALEQTWRTSIGPRYLQALGDTPSPEDAALHRQLVAEAEDFGELLRVALRGCEGGLTP